MKKILILLSLAAMVACTSKTERTNPFFEDWDTPYGTAPFSKIETADYLPAFEKGIAEQKADVEAIIANPEPATFENTIAAYDRSGALLAKVIGVFFNLAESDSTPEMQEIEETVTPMLTDAENEIMMNDALFQRVKAVYEDMDGLTTEQQKLTTRLYKDFVRNGVGLDSTAKVRFAEINTRLATLSQKFGQNLLAENNAFKAEMGITVSEYPSFMTTCEDRDKREKAFYAYSSRGNHGNENDNNEIVLEAMKLRAERSKLLGFDSFAAFQLDDKMAGNPARVDAFLARIMDASMAKAKEEITDMQKVMDEDIAAGLLPKGSKIEPWDWFYYAEKVRARKFDLDENLTKPYFQVDSVKKGLFFAAHKLYGINIEEAPDVEVYNPVAKAYKLTDADGSLVGIFYCDYFSRETKRSGAWMNNFRDQYITPEGEDVRPIIVNVCNFPPATEEQPSLLTVDEVQTAFHEFGHALHGFLSKCHYRSISGTSVTRDFVEMFSQFNENWAFQPEILDVYAHHYQTGEPIPAELVEKINNSLKFNQGFTTGELCAASILDMKWHELTVEEVSEMTTALDIRDFERKVCKDMGLIDEIIPRYSTTYFNHIFGSGYSAGYYGYLWSEVLDVDAFERFKREGLFNPELSMQFRRTFLEKGGSEDPMVLFRSFTGAEPNPDALLRARGLK